MTLPAIIRPRTKADWLPSLSEAARATIQELDRRDPRSKVLLAQFAARRSKPALYRWALELQCVPHSPNNNYLWHLLVAMKEGSPQAAAECAKILIGLGLGVSPTAGHFQSLEHLDPTEPLPKAPGAAVSKAPLGNLLDNFSDAKYDLSYRYEKGKSSTVLKLTYADGFRLDLDIYTICDTIDPAPMQAVARMYLGPGDRLMPLRLGPSTTPRLHRAKYDVALTPMTKDAEDFIDFVSIGLAGIMSNLPIGYLPGGAPPPTRTPAQRVPEPLTPRATENTGTARTGTQTTRPVDAAATSGTVANTNVPKPRRTFTPSTKLPANSNEPVPTGRGYPGVDGEVIGTVPQAQIPTAPPSSTAYGTAIERPIMTMIQQRFPRTRFRFSGGKGSTGVDVTWVGGEDPGFHIADIKPDTSSGWNKFSTQVRRIWDGGPQAPRRGPFKAAMIAYRPDGTVYFSTVLTVQP